MKFELEHKRAIKEAIEWVDHYHSVVIPEHIAKDLLLNFLESLDSENRDFSDEMIEARKTFAKLTEEQPDECAQKLWEDALASVGRA